MDFSPNWYDASFTQRGAIVIPAAFRTANLWSGKVFEVKNTQLPSQQKAPGICFAAKHKTHILIIMLLMKELQKQANGWSMV